jgi:glycosyltransferase involved in cell wall biosynthesis
MSPERVLLWGTGDKGKPRTRILLSALRQAGVTVDEIHADIWQGIEDKSRLNGAERFLRYAKVAASYPVLVARFMITRKPDAVLLSYPAQLDVLVLWTVAKLRRVPIVMDLFISLYDTAIVDRSLSPRRSFKATCLWSLEWLACRAADRVIIDTAAHARYIEELFGLPAMSVGDVPVGVEAEYFERLAPKARTDRRTVLFYGQLIPLHGIETVLAAALSDRGRAFNWVIVGDGQEAPKVAAAMAARPNHVTWIKWVPYDELRQRIEESDVCLGIFGNSRKASSVVPNKVYQSLASGRHVVTRSSPAMDDLRGSDGEGLTLVAPASVEALLDGIEAAIDRTCPPPSSALVNRFSSQVIGSRLIGYLKALQ